MALQPYLERKPMSANIMLCLHALKDTRRFGRPRDGGVFAIVATWARAARRGAMD